MAVVVGRSTGSLDVMESPRINMVRPLSEWRQWFDAATGRELMRYFEII